MYRKITPVAACVIAAVSGIWIGYAQPKQNPNFTGGSVTPLEDKEGQVAHFRFPAGVRTKWHSHSGGQIVLVEEGVGLHQVKGGPVQELHAGDIVYAGPGVVHWHGASPKEGGVQYNVARGSITWLDEVSEKEFSAPTARLKK